jgi:putative DNA primase/helicase
MTTASILEKFERAKTVSGGWMVRCPAHQDDTSSLSVSEGQDGRTLFHCHAGCDTDAILSALGLELRDLFRDEPRPSRGQPVAAYDYVDERGQLLYQSVRWPNSPDGKKNFNLRRPDGAGGWVWKVKGMRRVVYRLDKIQRREAIFIVEGEKDADRLWSLNLPATTKSEGAGGWTDDHTAQLTAAGVKRVVVLPDNDPPGEAHGLQVSRSCDDAGIFVRRILLPGLPEKGDVSDWLNAGHPPSELLAIVKAAPPFKGHASVVLKPKLELTSLADLLAEPDDALEWLVEDRIPGGGLVLLAGKPKAGKSTLARSLAFCVAAGEPWLGHHVVCGPVWYLALEDKRSEVRGHFRRMGATGSEPIWMLVGEAPQNCLALLEERAKDEKPVLIIVDTLQRLIQAKDMSDYAEVTTKFSPLLKLCRETGAACVVLHHANKYGEGLDCILGSTALSGSVDNIFIMGRGEHERTLQSIQRVGPDLDSTVVALDEETGHMSFAGTKRDAEIGRAAELIIESLRDEPSAQTEHWIREHVEAAPKSQAAALRMALRRNWVYRIGEGKRGNPYVYGLVSSGSEARKPEYVSANMGVRSGNGVKTAPEKRQDGQNTPCKKPENQNRLVQVHVSTDVRTEEHHVVSLVSTVGGNGNGSHVERHVNGSPVETYSGFASLDNGRADSGFQHQGTRNDSAVDIDDSLFANPDDEEGQP